MDKIYSRPRIKLPIIRKGNTGLPNPVQQKKRRKKIKILIILGIAIVTVSVVIRSFYPVFENICVNKAMEIATIISNEEATNVMINYRYEDLVTIYRDKDNNINMVKANIIPINEIASDVAGRIQKRLDSEETGNISIRLGTFTGSKLLSGRGPKVPIRISNVGNVETDLRSEFSQAGINQTLHRIYLQVKCKVSILTPFENIEREITNQVLLAENLIVGTVPSSYYNLEGMNKDNAVDIIQ
ncbi:MAG: sporulation protein YunB [Clostridia bacterium]